MVAWVCNLEGAGPGYDEPMGDLELTRVVNKLGMYDGEVPGRSLVEFLWV